MLTNLKFICAFADNCLYIKREKGVIVLLVLVYVDDIAVISPNSIQIISFKSALAKNFEIMDLGKLKFMLGILITHDHTKQLIYLNQSAYIH